MTAFKLEDQGLVSPALPAFSSVPEAASYLGVHPALVYKEIGAGRLKAVKIGAKVLRISRQALEAYIAAQSTAYIVEQSTRQK